MALKFKVLSVENLWSLQSVSSRFLEGLFDLGGGLAVLSGRGGGAAGEGAGGFDVGGVVESAEGVKGRVGEAHLHGAGLAARVVEEHGRGGDAAPEGVDAATVEVVAFAAVVALIAEGGFGPDAFGLVAVDGGAPFLIDKESAGGESLIANHPGGHAVAGSAGEEAVSGIGFEEFGGEARGLPVGVAVNDGPH